MWPSPDHVVLNWLLNGTCDQRYLDDIFVAFCQKMELQGLPLARAAAILHVEHPQWLDVRVLWRYGMVTADLSRARTFLRSIMTATRNALPLFCPKERQGCA